MPTCVLVNCFFDIGTELGYKVSRSEGGEPSEVSRAYLTIKEAADVSRLGSSTIRLYIRKRELKAYKVGRRVIIKRTDFVKFLESRPIVILSD